MKFIIYSSFAGLLKCIGVCYLWTVPVYKFTFNPLLHDSSEAFKIINSKDGIPLSVVDRVNSLPHRMELATCWGNAEK